MKARDIMHTAVVTVKPEATIEEIARILVENKISGVPVVDDLGNVIGIVSEGDLLYKEVSPRIPDVVNVLGAMIYYNGITQYNDQVKKLMARTAKEIMTTKVVTVDEDTDLSKIGKIMIEHKIKRVPVIKDWKLVGIVSRSDMIKTLY